MVEYCYKHKRIKAKKKGGVAGGTNAGVRAQCITAAGDRVPLSGSLLGNFF